MGASVPANTPALAPQGSATSLRPSAATLAPPAGDAPPSVNITPQLASLLPESGEPSTAEVAPRALNSGSSAPQKAASTTPWNPGASLHASAASQVVPSSGRVRVSSGIMAGNLLYAPTPKYPRGFATLFHMEGHVTLQAIIARDGRVENLRVLSGHRLLRGAAQDAVRTWRYRPYVINGVPVEVATIVTVEFHR